MEAARGKPEIFATFRKANARKFQFGPEANIKCIEAAVNLSFDGPDGGAAPVHGVDQVAQSIAQRYARRAGGCEDPGVPADTRFFPSRASASLAPARWAAAFAMNFLNAGIPGDDHRGEAGGAGSRRRHHPQELRDARRPRAG
jgi:3-hydroxyacyl-CoA dehydrogenase